MTELFTLVAIFVVGWFVLPPEYDRRVLPRRQVLGGRELLHALRVRR